MPDSDYSLYLVFGTDFIEQEKMESFLRETALGGVNIVQLREKNISFEKYVNLAKIAKAVLKPFKIPLIVNDNIDTALQSEADGIHLGQSDGDVLAARKILGPDAIIGLSIENIKQAIEAVKLPLNYISVSPLFYTDSKKDIAEPLGLEGLKEIKKIAPLMPVTAIGGINSHNAADVIKAGADGICVISAICGAENPKHAAQNLIDKIKKARLHYAA
ncbi:MAG: thiamine phosphate synthase [Elusimicrobiales bacterium]|nr:thiamine phosphate synthase [Elusimicrobiales bacterium]